MCRVLNLKLDKFQLGRTVRPRRPSPKIYNPDWELVFILCDICFWEIILLEDSGFFSSNHCTTWNDVFFVIYINRFWSIFSCIFSIEKCSRNPALSFTRVRSNKPPSIFGFFDHCYRRIFNFMIKIMKIWVRK